jgi:CubicO group peptidase (beta-lactamase class C family)
MTLLRMPSLVVLSAVVLSSGGFAGELATTGRTNEPALEAAIPTCKTELATRLRALKVPGLSVGIVKNGHLVCASGAGLANIEQKKPVSRNTVFAWASVSKTATAIAAMILYDRGKFRLDDDIDKFLAFRVRNPNCPDKPITFRQLLTHSSSIVDNRNIYDASYTKGDSPVPLGDFVRGYVTPDSDYYDTDNFADECPGQVSRYSNVAVGLLGYLVERISGTPFDKFVKEEIFRPLGMRDASFRLADLDLNNVAMPYRDRIPLGHVGFPTYPDGLLRASVPSMARLLSMMANGGRYGDRRILKESTVQEMLRIQDPKLDKDQGLIWYRKYKNLYGHNGSDPGTAALMFYDPKNTDGVLIVANGEWSRAHGRSEADRLLADLMSEARRQHTQY